MDCSCHPFGILGSCKYGESADYNRTLLIIIQLITYPSRNLQDIRYIAHLLEYPVIYVFTADGTNEVGRPFFAFVG